jgi:hypothetical protein
MYLVITYYDDYENRPWQEVEECYSLEEVEELKKEIGEDQRYPISMKTVVREVK